MMKRMMSPITMMSMTPISSTMRNKKKKIEWRKIDKENIDFLTYFIQFLLIIKMLLNAMCTEVEIMLKYNKINNVRIIISVTKIKTVISLIPLKHVLVLVIKILNPSSSGSPLIATVA